MRITNPGNCGLATVLEFEQEWVVTQFCSAHLSFFDIDGVHLDDTIVDNDSKTYERLTIKEWLKAILVDVMDKVNKNSKVSVGAIHAMVTLPDRHKYLEIDFSCRGVMTHVDYIHHLVDSF